MLVSANPVDIWIVFAGCCDKYRLCGCTIAKHCFNLRPQSWYRGQKWLYSPLLSSIPTFLYWSLCLCPRRGLPTLGGNVASAEAEGLLGADRPVSLGWYIVASSLGTRKIRFDSCLAEGSAFLIPDICQHRGNHNLRLPDRTLGGADRLRLAPWSSPASPPGELRFRPITPRWPQPGSTLVVSRSEGLSQLFNQSCGIRHADSLPVFKDSVPFFWLLNRVERTSPREILLPSWAGSLLSPCPIDCPLRRFHSLDCPYLRTQTFKHPSFSTAAPIPSSHRLTRAAAAQLLLRARCVGGRIRLCHDLFGEIGGKHARFPIEMSFPPALLHLTQEQKPSGIFPKQILHRDRKSSFSTLQLPIYNQLILSVAYH